MATRSPRTPHRISATASKGARRKRSGTTTSVTERSTTSSVPAAAARTQGDSDATAMNEVLRIGMSATARQACSAGTRSRASWHVGSAAPAGSQIQSRDRDVLVAALRSRPARRCPTAEWQRRKTNGCRRRRSRIPPEHHGPPVYEPGKFANYIAPPVRGINRQPVNFEYVRTEA